MKRIILCLLLLLLLSSFVQAKEKSASIVLSTGEGIIFFDNNLFTVLNEIEQDFDLRATVACDIFDTSDGIPTPVLRLKDYPILTAKMIYMGNEPLESYEDCSSVMSGKLTGISPSGIWEFTARDFSGRGKLLSEGDVYCLLTNDGKYYVKIKISLITKGDTTPKPEIGLSCCKWCGVAFDYVLQDDSTPYFGSKALQPSISAITIDDVKPDIHIGDLYFYIDEERYEGIEKVFYYESPEKRAYQVVIRDVESETNAKSWFEKAGDFITQNSGKCEIIYWEEKEIKKCYNKNDATIGYYFYHKNLYFRIENPVAYSGSTYELDNEISSRELDIKILTDNIFSKISGVEEEKVEIAPSISVKAPNVITKRVTAGTINVQDGEIVFEISNEDPNHKLEGYLSCDIPNDVIVTSSMGAATGEEAQYISQKFVVDPAPARESMSLGVSSQNEGSKNIRCSVNYVLFKEGKGYVTSKGQYSADKKYQQVTVNRDVQFIRLEENTNQNIATYWYFIAGVGVVVLLLIIFLVYKLGHVSGQIKNKKGLKT